MTQSSTENISLKQKVIFKLWPIAAIFFAVYIPVSFFILNDNVTGWFLLSTFLVFILSMIYYNKTKNIQIVGNLFAMLGFPVLMPWLITGGPSGAGFWWSLVNVVWIFFVAKKKSAIFWSVAYLFVTLVMVLLSEMGLFKIAYTIPELLNFLFAFIIIFFLVYLFNETREYYLELSEKRADELMKLNKELMLANNELKQFAYVASHDLQAPLRTISNFVGLLKEKYSGKQDPETDQYIGFVLKGTAKMQNLIKDLLDYSRVGKNITFEQVNCNEVLKEVLEEIETTIKESNAKITSTVLPILKGNKIELKRLFQNLITNAVKFQNKESIPEIEISCVERENQYLFNFSDNGIGIDEKNINKLFVIFQRLPTSFEYPGTGIGLATCKKIVEMHNGKIWVESRLGEGSSFYFCLPKELL